MIEIENLTKSFAEIKAVKGVSFNAQKGEVVGFLGPNGAGKSTTMKMLTCFIKPTSGHAKICGADIREDEIEVKRNIGYMPENAPLYGEMTVYHFLEFAAQVREIPAGEQAAKMKNVVELCGLQQVLNQKIETLSKGFKRRVSMAQALIHDPKVLILDEPTDGLDPNQKHDVRELIKKLSQEKCIVLSTHILEEVESVCSRVIIISEGRLKFDGTPQELASKSQHKKLDDVFRAMTTGAEVEGVSL